MKKVFLTAALILTVCLASFANQIVAKGQSGSAFGNYKIEALDDHLILNGKELDQYLITYEKTNLKMIVALDQNQKCMKYYVLSEKLPVQYECNGLYFGIEKLDAEFAAKGYRTSPNMLGNEEFYNQGVLTSESARPLDHLKLIAFHYPGLFKKKVVKDS